MRKGIKKKIIYIIISCILIYLIYSLFRGCGQNISTVYKYDKASIGEIKKTVSVSGQIEVVNSHIILSKIDGIVKNVYADFNQYVKKDQVLAVLDASEINQKVLKADAERERMALELLSAKKDVDAKKDLLKDNLISEKAVELSELNYKKVATQLNQINVEYKTILMSLSYTKILSPCAGIVVSREVEANTPINQNKVLFIIAEDLKKMQLILQVDESDIGYIKTGQSVQFTVSAFPEKIFNGTISQVRINPVVKPQGQVVSYESIVTCENSELLLKPGMTATATVVVYNKASALRVPNEAFIVSPAETEADTKKKYIWRKKTLSMDKLPVERIEVKTGIMGDFFTEILSNSIREGDSILTGIEKKLESNKGMYDL